MRLSERGAIRRAIAEGGICLYPAGLLMERIKAGNAGDELTGDFDPPETARKVLAAKGPEDANATEVFRRDVELLAGRLGLMSMDYDIESIFDRMVDAAPELARRYYGIEGFEAHRPKIVEYFFEGYSDLYRDGDWFAFNVNSAESKDLGVPVGTYFKRNQVTPGHPEFVTLHEANHAMQDRAYLSSDVNHYVPWFDEGVADAMSRMMLARVTGDWKMMELLKRLRMEVEVSDPRKATYHFGEEIAIMMILRGRLPFIRALMDARKREPFSIDYNLLGRAIKDGIDPHVAAVQAYKGQLEKSFLKKMERNETKFRKEGDLDSSDLKALNMFLATERPACLPPIEYKAAMWLVEAVADRPPESANVKLADIPDELKEGVAKLSAKYFVVKKEVSGEVVYDPYGGGLPYRLGVGEIRCSY